MSLQENKIVKFVKEEFLVLVFLFLFIFTIQQGVLLAFGWANLVSYPPAFANDPQAFPLLRNLPDADDDGLPDAIEVAPAGVAVYANSDLEVFDSKNNDNVLIGWGTDSNPNRKDTDGDGFTDLAESKMGTGNRNWFDPGWFWIVWGSFLAVVAYVRFIRTPDRVKQYERNEAFISSGGVSKKGKYAYGGSAFAKKKYDDMTPEEREQAVLEDQRFHQLTAESGLPKRGRTRGNPVGKMFQIFIVMFVVLILYILFFL